MQIRISLALVLHQLNFGKMKMGSIVKANRNDAALLSELGKQTFLESHGHSASPDNIKAYVSEKFNTAFVSSELSNSANLFYIIYHQNKPAGYSKIILDEGHPNISLPHVTKLERLYLLETFYDSKLGAELFRHNVAVSKEHGQAGMWLFVWKENLRAIRFYTKAGFEVIGDFYFKLTEEHSNPNHQMLLKY
jgi:ribosomal protein S18 acetylase RimI-like enzyme